MSKSTKKPKSVTKNQSGFELLEQANAAEREFFALMKKYKSMKNGLQNKYLKMKKHLEIANAKVKKYKAKVETKQKEIKYLQSEIKVLKKKEQLGKKEKSKLESTEVQGMRAFHEAQLAQLKASLSNLEKNYRTKLDGIVIDKNLQVEQLREKYKSQVDSQRLRLEAQALELTNLQAEQLEWGIERSLLLKKIDQLQKNMSHKVGEIGNAQELSPKIRSKRRRKKGHSKSEILPLDPLTLLKSSCEVLEELGMDLQHSAAKISKMSNQLNKSRSKSKSRRTDFSPSSEIQKMSQEDRANTGVKKRNTRKQRKRMNRIKGLDSQSQRVLPREYISFGNNVIGVGDGIEGKSQTKLSNGKKKKRFNKRAKRKRKSYQSKKDINPNIFENVKFKQFRTEPHHSTPIGENQEEDIQNYLNNLGLTKEQKQFFGNFSNNNSASKVKLSSLTQDIHRLLHSKELEQSSLRKNLEVDNMNDYGNNDPVMDPHYLHNNSNDVSKEINEEYESREKIFKRNTFSGEKNSTYLDMYGVSNIGEKETARLPSVEQNNHEQEKESGQGSDSEREFRSPKHIRSSSRTKLDSLINRVLDEHNSIKKVNQGFEKKLERIETLITRLSEQQQGHPFSAQNQSPNNYSNIKITENGRVRSTIGELRNSAEKIIGRTAQDREISMLEAQVNQSQDILNTGEKQIMAAYSDEGTSNRTRFRLPQAQLTHSNIKATDGLELAPPQRRHLDNGDSHLNRASMAQNQKNSLTNPTFESNRITLEGHFNRPQNTSVVTENIFITPQNDNRGSSPQILLQSQENEGGFSHIKIKENTQILKYMDSESAIRPRNTSSKRQVGDSNLGQEVFGTQEELGEYSESSNMDQMFFTNKYQEIIEQINSMKREMEMINDENESLLKVMDDSQLQR